MNIDFTRPTLFRSILYFLLLYTTFRFREYFLVEDLIANDTVLMPLERWFAGFLAERAVWRETVLLLLTVLTAFSITRILSRNLIYLERTYVPSMIYPLLALGYATSGVTPTVLMAAFLVVYATDNMIKAHKQDGNYGCFLNASIALGIAPLLYAPAVVFFLLLPVGFTLFRQSWRSVVISLIGYLVPVFFNAYILWGMGGDFGDTGRQILAGILASRSEVLFVFRMEIWDYFLVAVFLGLMVFALFNFYGTQTQIRRRALRGYALFTWMLVLSIGMIALPCRSLDMLPLLAVPLAAIIPSCFNRKSGWLPNLLYLLMLWSVILYNIYLLYPYLTA